MKLVKGKQILPKENPKNTYQIIIYQMFGDGDYYSEQETLVSVEEEPMLIEFLELLNDYDKMNSYDRKEIKIFRNKYMALNEKYHYKFEGMIKTDSSGDYYGHIESSTLYYFDEQGNQFEVSEED